MTSGFLVLRRKTGALLPWLCLGSTVGRVLRWKRRGSDPAKRGKISFFLKFLSVPDVDYQVGY